MVNRRRTEVSLGMGGTLIITVFMVLCLMIFAALSFTTAYSDLKLSMRAQDMTVDYYYIHGQAEEKLSQISDVLFDSNINDSTNSIIKNLSKIEGLSLIDEENLTVQYQVLGEKNQKISEELNVLNDANKYYYEITTWSLSNIEVPLYEDEIIDIWEGIE